MSFTVIWMRGPQAMGTKSFDELTPATNYAEDNLPHIQTRFGATAVKIIDATGNPLYLKALSRNG